MKYKQGEKHNHMLTSQQTPTTSIQGREEPQRNTPVEELHTTTTSRRKYKKTFYKHLIFNFNDLALNY
jgi:hypothetical protein